MGLPLTHAPMGEQAWNPGVCLDRELNPQILGIQYDIQQTEPHQSGPLIIYLKGISPAHCDNT